MSRREANRLLSDVLGVKISLGVLSVDFAHIRGEVVRDGGSASRRGPMA
jgi:hypothetical protein